MKGRFFAVVVLCVLCAMAFWILRLAKPSPGAGLLPRSSTPIEPAPTTRQNGHSHSTDSPKPLSTPSTLTDSAPPAPAADTPNAAAASVPSIEPDQSANPVPAITSSPEDSASGYVSPSAELDQLQLTIRNFGGRFGANPVGTNTEITAALNGGNPKHVRFLDPAARINAKGELLDAWNTPYFFHQLSSHQMEIRSAGADRKMWTSDDLISY